MNRISPVRRLAAAALSLTLVVSLFVLTSGTAQAATQTKTLPAELSGSVPKQTLFDTGLLVCDDCYPDALNGFTPTALGTRAAINLDVKYVQPTLTTLNYNDTLLRQGSPLDLTDTLVMQPGHVHAVFHFIVGTNVLLQDAQGHWIETPIDLSGIPDIDIPLDFPCTMPVSGSQDCSPVSLITLPIVGLPIVPGVFSIDLNFHVNVTFSVDSTGIVTVRKADVIGGQPGTLDQNLQFSPPSPATTPDPLSIPCNEPAGNDVTYALSHSYPVVGNMGLGFSLDVDFTFVGAPFHIANLWSDTLASAPLPEVTLHADDASTMLGTLGADNLPPTASVGASPYSGAEGTPISFDGSGSTDNCGAPTLKWTFSDGGVAFGPNPTHTFADNGAYTALLTATDVAGNSTSSLLNINVSNQAPTANAGPDTAAAWGRPVSFGGSGVDPGSADQASLAYSWDFGDGSPSAAGGPDTVHSYATPGNYIATLTVCDKDGACGSDTRSIAVRRRTVAVSLVGSTAGVYDTVGTVKASAVDEYGAAVQGRVVTFTLDGAPYGQATTNSSGIATLTAAPEVVAGAHTLAASTAQDTLYDASNIASGGYAVGLKATTVTYSGALTGTPNKVITLSAKLVDATGTPLAGRTINFLLGTQSASAVTDANGQASTTLKLTQKNGTYTVSATFTPAGADATHYSGNATINTFKLQSK